VKEANALLFWVVGLPMMAIIWIAMVGVEAGVASLLCAAVSGAIVLLIKNRKEN
jgi:hypothetical protein